MSAKKKRDYTLSESQKVLVEKNHRLIYDYIYKHNLDVEEWYGELSEALCVAANTYDEEKSKFSTYAYTCFSTVIKKQAYRKKVTKKLIPDGLLFSIDDTIKDGIEDNTSTFQEVIGLPETFTSNIENKMLIQNLKSCLNEKEKTVVDFKMQGLTYKEISKKMGFSRQYSEQIYKRALEKMRRKIKI